MTPPIFCKKGSENQKEILSSYKVFYWSKYLAKKAIRNDGREMNMILGYQCITQKFRRLKSPYTRSFLGLSKGSHTEDPPDVFFTILCRISYIMRRVIDPE